MLPSYSDTPTGEPLDGYVPASLKARHDGGAAADVPLDTRRKRAGVGHGGAGADDAAVGLSLALSPAGPGFAQAWDEALLCGAARLTVIALERATVGGMREVWNDGAVVSETRAPFDRLPIFLLQHLAPHHFGVRVPGAPDRATAAQRQFETRLHTLTDIDTSADPLRVADYLPVSRDDSEPTGTPETRA